MLGALFSFRGRLDRMAYFGWVFVAGIIVAVGFAILLVMGFSAGFAKGAGGAIVGTTLAVVIGLIPLIWMSLALATKRLRDAGLPPLIVVPAVMAFSLFDMLVLSRQTGGQTFGGFLHNSPAGMGVNLAYGLVLLFWPSSDAKGGSDDGEVRRPGEGAWHERALAIASTLPPQQVADPYPSQMPPSGQARTFGRRLA